MCEMYGTLCHSGLCSSCINGENMPPEKIDKCSVCGSWIYSNERYADFEKGVIAHEDCVTVDLLKQIYDFDSIATWEWADFLGFQMKGEENG